MNSFISKQSNSPLILATICILVSVRMSGTGFAQTLIPQVTDLDSLATPDLRPSCPTVRYKTVPPPDRIDSMFKGRKRYRLVIGADEFQDHPEVNNRPYVRATATLIDERLNALGYEPLPSLKVAAAPYLTGKNATKDAIRSAVKEMAAATSGHDFGVIYYVGHGNISPGGDDLSLGVYDRPVLPDDGYKFGDLVGELKASIFRTSVAEIPHIFIVLDSCFSGTVAQSETTAVVTAGGVQRLVIVGAPGPVIPDQIAVLTATANGSTDSAYELRGTGLSAFGYYFARALREDWDCADNISRDGVLTLLELKKYLRKRLKFASDSLAISATMQPTSMRKDDNDFFAYRPEKYHESGFHEAFDDVDVQLASGTVATLTLPGGDMVQCSSAKGCSFPISRKYRNSNLAVSVSKSTANALPPGMYSVSESLAMLIDPITGKPRTNNTNDVKDVDSRSQAAIKNEMNTAKAADQHAQDAANHSNSAITQAGNPGYQTDVFGAVANLDQYQTVSETSVKFGAGRTVLGPTGKSHLDTLATRLAGEKGYIIEVQGYSQNGVHTSQAMADSVARYLVTEHQVPVYRIYRSGLGKNITKLADREQAIVNGVRVTLLHNELAQMGGQNNTSKNALPTTAGGIAGQLMGMIPGGTAGGVAARVIEDGSATKPRSATFKIGDLKTKAAVVGGASVSVK